MKQAKGVAFLDIEDFDSDLQEPLESTHDLLPEHLATAEAESSRSETPISVKHMEHMPSTLHRKEDDVPFLPDKVCGPDQQ